MRHRMVDRHEYNPLTDKYLHAYFQKENIQKHLSTVGLVTDEGRVLSNAEFKRNTHISQYEKYARQQLTQNQSMSAMSHSLGRKLELQRQLDAVAKVEIFRRIKGLDTVDDGSLDTIADPQDVYSRIQNTKRTVLPRSISMNQDGLASSSGYITEEEDSKKRRSGSESRERKKKLNRYLQDVAKYRYLHKLDNKSLGNYGKHLMRELNELEKREMLPELKLSRNLSKSWNFENRVPPIYLPKKLVTEEKIPSKPRIPLHRPRSLSSSLRSSDESNKQEKNVTRRSKMRSQSKPTQPETLPPISRTVKSRTFMTSAAAKKRTNPSKTFHPTCACFIQYLGPTHKTKASSDKKYSIQIKQQHNGGNSIIIFKEDIKPQDVFYFFSHRNTGFPFTISIEEDGKVVAQRSTCCEARSTISSLIDGKNGVFRWLGVRNALPCYQCQTQRGYIAPFSNYDANNKALLKDVQKKEGIIKSAKLTRSSTTLPVASTNQKPDLKTKDERKEIVKKKKKTKKSSEGGESEKVVVLEEIENEEPKENNNNNNNNNNNEDREADAEESVSESTISNTSSDLSSSTSTSASNHHHQLSHEGQESRVKDWDLPPIPDYPATKNMIADEFRSRKAATKIQRYYRNYRSHKASSNEDQTDEKDIFDEEQDSETVSEKSAVPEEDTSDSSKAPSLASRIHRAGSALEELEKKFDKALEEVEREEVETEDKQENRRENKNSDTDEALETPPRSPPKVSRIRIPSPDSSVSQNESKSQQIGHNNQNDDVPSKSESVPSKKLSTVSETSHVSKKSSSRSKTPEAVGNQPEQHSSSSDSQSKSSKQSSKASKTSSKTSKASSKASKVSSKASAKASIVNEQAETSEWTCNSCSHVNPAFANRCQLCVTAKPEPTIKKEEHPTSEGPWNCLVCNFDNIASNTQCRICAATKGTKPSSSEEESSTEEESSSTESKSSQSASKSASEAKTASEVKSVSNKEGLDWNARTMQKPSNSDNSEESEESKADSDEASDSSKSSDTDSDTDTLADAQSIKDDHEQPPVMQTEAIMPPNITVEASTPTPSQIEQERSVQPSYSTLGQLARGSEPHSEDSKAEEVKQQEETSVKEEKEEEHKEDAEEEQETTLDEKTQEKEKMKALLKECKENQKVNLLGTDLSDAHTLKHVVHELGENKQLTTLNLRGCNLNDRALQSISRSLEESKIALSVINLNSNAITDEGAIHVLRLIRGRPMEILMLHENQLEDEGMAQVLDGLCMMNLGQSGMNIRKLDLGDNGLGEKSATALARVIGLATGLQSLNLGGCKNLNWKTVAEGIKINASIESIALDYCNMGDEAIVHVANAFHNKAQLRIIDVDGNSLGDKGGSALIDMTRTLTSIENVVAMAGNDIPADKLHTIKQIINAKRTGADDKEFLNIKPEDFIKP